MIGACLAALPSCAARQRSLDPTSQRLLAAGRSRTAGLKNRIAPVHRTEPLVPAVKGMLTVASRPGPNSRNRHSPISIRARLPLARGTDRQTSQGRYAAKQSASAKPGAVQTCLSASRMAQGCWRSTRRTAACHGDASHPLAEEVPCRKRCALALPRPRAGSSDGVEAAPTE